jgi:hypothetical protein
VEDPRNQPRIDGMGDVDPEAGEPIARHGRYSRDQ